MNLSTNLIAVKVSILQAVHSHSAFSARRLSYDDCVWIMVGDFIPRLKPLALSSFPVHAFGLLKKYFHIIGLFFVVLFLPSSTCSRFTFLGGLQDVFHFSVEV